MPSDTHPDSRSPPVTTGGARPPPAEPGQPPAGSGFGALLQQEHELRARIAGSLAEVDGPHAIAIGRILDNQQTRIADNIALLEQRHDTFPDLARTEAMRGRVPRWTGDPAGGERSSTRLLSALLGEHVSLLETIDTLYTRRPDGQRSELILAEVARNHEEMAWMLTALLKEDGSAARNSGC